MVVLAGKMERGELGYVCLGGGGWRNVGGETLTISFTISSGTGIPHSIPKAWHSTGEMPCDQSGDRPLTII